MDLTLFSWKYNKSINIGDFYHSDATIDTPKNTSNPAFVSVQLRAVSQNPLNPVLGNFSSTLTVDLSQLEQQNIMNISCGDPGERGTIPVSVQILQQSMPGDPQLVAVNTTYKTSKLATANIQWKIGVSIHTYTVDLIKHTS